VVTDEKDNYLFALCRISNADYFITGDKLLLAVNEYYKTSILNLADFKNIIA
jgi:predicted nucleic acid-binding protein